MTVQNTQTNYDDGFNSLLSTSIDSTDAAL